MEKIKEKKHFTFVVIGLVIMALSLFLFFIKPFSNFTGFVISENLVSLSSYASSLVPLLLFLVGLLLFTLRKEVSLEISVREAVAVGVPPEPAEKIFEGCNNLVSSGKWVQLKSIAVGRAKNRKYLHGTSLCKYWGPSEYRGLNAKKLTQLYHQGKLGKTHEIYRGSNEYGSEGISHPNRGARILHRHWEIEQMYHNGISFD